MRRLTLIPAPPELTRSEHVCPLRFLFEYRFSFSVTFADFGLLLTAQGIARLGGSRSPHRTSIDAKGG